MSRKKWFTLPMAALLSFILLFSSAMQIQPVKAASFKGYTKISSAKDLAKIADDPTGKYYLAKNINLSSYGDWTPIENFSGVFDGNGKEISNLFSTKGGLFANVCGSSSDKKAVIKDVTLKNIDIQTGNVECIGALANTLENTSVTNCQVSGSITASGSCVIYAGMAGTTFNTEISKCKSSLSINAATVDCIYAGGITGGAAENTGISECLFDGEIITNWVFNKYYNHTSNVGGIIGSVYGDGCTVTNTVSASKKMEVTFTVAGWLQKSYAYLGGIAGSVYKPFTILNSYAAGTDYAVIVDHNNQNDLGHWGFWPCAIVGCLLGNDASVAANNVFYYQEDEKINSYVEKEEFSGHKYGSTGLWADGIGEVENPKGVTKLNTKAMKKKASYTNWDFKKVWAIDSNNNNGMPTLRCFATLEDSADAVEVSKVKEPISALYGTNVIVGYAEANATVYVQIGNKKYSSTANKSGVYKIKTAKLVKDSEYTIWQNVNDIPSEKVTYKVTGK